MKRTRSISKSVPAMLFGVVFLMLCLVVQAQAPPFTVLPGLFDQSDQDSLGLTTAEGTETVTIFGPSDTTDHYSNGVFMTAFKGWLYCQWQSSAQDEDARDTVTVFAAPSLPGGPVPEIYAGADRIIRIVLPETEREATVSIYTITGRLLYRGFMHDREMQYDAKRHPAGLYIIDVRTGRGRRTEFRTRLMI
ncbi:MAG: T9SS type A sorting domain-containing protein [Bacteroidales bacterium]|nr:T9SS type A sorting domain-containing protein [Bacteroidales bacterium]